MTQLDSAHDRTTRPLPEVSRRAGHEGDHAAATREMFDRVAARYDLLNKLMSAGIDARWRRAAVRELASIGDGPLLDLCAGTLDVSAALEKAFPGREVTAVDFSSAMLEAGKKRGITQRTTTVVGDAMNLPLADSMYAGALCSFGVRNIADQGASLRELRRVLKPGGVAVVLEFFRPETAFTKLFHGLYANVVIPNLGRIVAGDRSSYEYLAKSMQGFLSRPEYEREMGLAGFVCVRGFDVWGGIASIVRGEVPR